MLHFILEQADDTKIGVTHATIGAGTITIAGQAATDDQLNGVNRDVNKVQEILVDEHDHLDIEIPLDGIKNITDMVSDIVSKLNHPDSALSAAVKVTDSLKEKLERFLSSSMGHPREILEIDQLFLISR